MNIPRSSLEERDDIVNSKNWYEAFAMVMNLQFYPLFLTVTGLPARVETTCPPDWSSLNDWRVMVISQPPGNNPSYYYRASQRCTSIALNASRRHLMFYTCNYNIRVTHRNGAIKHIFYTDQIWRDHQQIVLYSFVAPCLALHLAVKYYFKSFCMKIWAR